MVRAFLLAASLTGCLVETFTDGESGTVYECVGPDATVKEWCAVADAAELGRETGRMCSETGRLWPRFTNAFGNGCVWSCEPHSGANAKNGVWGCP